MRRELPIVAAALAMAACTTGSPAPNATRSPASSGTAPPPVASPSLHLAFKDLPKEFYGVLRGRIAAFDSVTGTRLRWVTSPPAGSVDGSPSLVESSRGPAIAFLRTTPAAPCDTARILRVGVDGGRESELYRPGGIVTLADAGGDHVSFAYRNCGDGAAARVRAVRLSDGFVTVRGRTAGTIVSLLGSGYDIEVRVRDRRGKTWHAGVTMVFTHEHEVDIDRVQRRSVPAGCEAGNVLPAGRPDGPGRATSVLLATLTCATSDGYELRQATYGQDGPEVGPAFARAPAFYELTANDGTGYLLGVRGEDDGTRYVRRVFQVAGTEERELAPCTSRDGTADACVSEAVW